MPTDESPALECNRKVLDEFIPTEQYLSMSIFIECRHQLVEDVEGLAIVGASDLNGLMEQNPAFVLSPKTTFKLFLLNPHDHTAVCVQYGSSDFHCVIDETVYLPLTQPSEKVRTLGINHDERDPASAFD